MDSSAVEIQNAVNVFHRPAALDRAEPQGAGLKILRTLAITNTASSEKAVEVRVELQAIRLQDSAVNRGVDVAFCHEQLTPGVVGLAIGLEA